MEKKNIVRLVDVLMILIFVGIKILILNFDDNFDNHNIIFRYIWLSLSIAYFIGRSVSHIAAKK